MALSGGLAGLRALRDEAAVLDLYRAAAARAIDLLLVVHGRHQGAAMGAPAGIDPALVFWLHEEAAIERAQRNRDAEHHADLADRAKRDSDDDGHDLDRIQLGQTPMLFRNEFGLCRFGPGHDFCPSPLVLMTVLLARQGFALASPLLY